MWPRGHLLITYDDDDLRKRDKISPHIVSIQNLKLKYSRSRAVEGVLVFALSDLRIQGLYLVRPGGKYVVVGSRSTVTVEVK